MNYQEISIESLSGVKKHILINNVDGSFKSFPVDNSNPSYISFLRELSEENPDDPHYLAWIEAGNTPEDFWTQDDDLEPSEPKEEETTEGES